MAIHPFRSAALRRRIVYPGCALALLAAGCPYLNPSFLNVVAPDSPYVTIPNAPGFVVLALLNNATVDEQLVEFLAPQLDLTPEQLATLKPRMRMKLRITFTDGTFQTVEMVEGSSTFVDPDFDAQSQPDLQGNTLTNVVPICDVASIALEPNTNIEVFVPVELIGYQQVEISAGDVITTEWQQRTEIQPQFTALQVDDVDEDGNTILRRNIDPRDVLSPTTNIVCGSVVAVVVDGVLSVPFLTAANPTDPSYDVDDPAQVASIGGRFEFSVSTE